MSTRIIQSNIERTQREILNLNRQLAAETKKEADRTDRIIRAKQAISRSSSSSAVQQGKLWEIQRYEREIGQVQKKKADFTKQLADKSSRLHSYQEQLLKEQRREQKVLLDSLKRSQLQAQRDRAAQLSRTVQPTADGAGASPASPVKHDAFISHASEDKGDLVHELAAKLTAAGFDIWYDDFQLTVGDSLRRSIDRGLASSRFGIVVLSPAFFGKNWPQYELDGLVSREMSEGTKVILPLWHKVSKDEVRSYSPSLADKVALNTAVQTLDEVVEELSRVLKPNTG